MAFRTTRTAFSRGFPPATSFSSSPSGATAKVATGNTENGISPAGAAFFGSLCIGTFGLGCWQTSRYFEKTDKISVREHGLAADPVPLGLNSEVNHVVEDVGTDKGPESDSPAVELSFRRSTLNGNFRHQHEVLVGPRGPPPGAVAVTGPSSGRSSGGMSSSPQGYFVVTPLTRTGGAAEGETVLVNRGWVPLSFMKEKRSWHRPVGTIKIVGVPTETESETDI